MTYSTFTSHNLTYHAQSDVTELSRFNIKICILQHQISRINIKRKHNDSYENFIFFILHQQKEICLSSILIETILHSNKNIPLIKTRRYRCTVQ